MHEVVSPLPLGDSMRNFSKLESIDCIVLMLPVVDPMLIKNSPLSPLFIAFQSSGMRSLDCRE